MAEETKKNEKQQIVVSGKSTVFKNILFLVLIVVVIAYCFNTYRAGNRYKAFEKAAGIYDNAVMLAEAKDGASLAGFVQAREICQAICSSAKDDPELKVDAEDLLAKTYARMAGCPQVSAKMADGYMLLALETSGACPLVGDPMRERIGLLTAEEKSALREFVSVEEKRLLQGTPEQSALPPAASPEPQVAPEG